MIYFKFVSFYLIVRLFYLTFLHPYYYTLGGGEEPYVGMIGLELLKGPHFPLYEYLISDYQPGSFIVALLSVPFYALLGLTSFATKIVSLLLGLGAMLFWMRLIQKNVSEKVAALFGILFALSPPGFTQFSITALGYHSESIFFTAACLYFLFEIISNRASFKTYALFGFFAGLGLCFAMIFGISLLAMFLFWCFKEKRFAPNKNFGILALFFFIGFSPWFAFNIPNQFSGFSVYQKPIWEHFHPSHLIQGLTQIKSSILFHFPASFASPFWGMAPGIKKMGGLPYAFLFLSLISFGLFKGFQKKEKQPLIQYSLFFLGFFLFVVQFGGFVSPRYMMPLHPFVFFLSALGLSSIGFASKKKIVMTSIFFGTVFLFTHQFALSKEYRGRIFSTKGYGYQWIDDTVCEKIELCLEKYPELQKDLSPEDLNDFSSEFARKVADSLDAENLNQELGRIILKLPQGFDRYFYYFLGRRMALENEDYQKALGRIEIIKPFSQKGYRLAVFGVLDVAGIQHQNSNLQSLEKKYHKHYWRAVGIESAAVWDIEDASNPEFQKLLKESLGKLPEEARSPFLEGIGRFFHYRWRSFETAPYFDHFKLESLPLEYQADVFRGVGRAFVEKAFEWQIADHAWYLEVFVKNLRPENIHEIERGQKEILEPLFK